MNATNPGYLPQDWQVHDNRQRLLSAALAVLITLFFAQQFRHKEDNKSLRDLIDRPFGILILQPRPALVPRLAKQTLNTKLATSTREKNTLQKQAVKPTLNVVTEIAAPPINTSEPSVSMPSAPLQIDAKAIRKAYNDSKSDIQKMAEASGKEMNTPITSKYDEFQGAAHNAAKPDCIGKDSSGAGLLAIPLIAYWLVTDKCK